MALVDYLTSDVHDDPSFVPHAPSPVHAGRASCCVGVGVGVTPGSTVARGYGAQHKQLRAAAKPTVNAGLAVCWRCGRPILPRPWLIGDGWDVGHDDHDRTIYRGPEHTECNRAAGARKGNARRAKMPKRRRSRIW